MEQWIEERIEQRRCAARQMQARVTICSGGFECREVFILPHEVVVEHGHAFETLANSGFDCRLDLGAVGLGDGLDAVNLLAEQFGEVTRFDSGAVAPANTVQTESHS